LAPWIYQVLTRNNNMTIAMERVLAWKLMPRLMMLVMTLMYVQVLHWFMGLSPDAMTSQATALTATVTGAMTGAFAVWLGHEK
jgi:hypothetical protein